MKKLLLSLAALSLLSASCKKSSSSSPSPSTPDNGWKMGTTTYTSVFVARSGSSPTSASLTALDALPTAATQNKCTIYFSAFPSAGGTFRVASVGSVISLSATQIGVTAQIGSTFYASTGFDGIDATVTVTGGKIKVVVPDVWVKNIAGSDSSKLTGTILEN